MAASRMKFTSDRSLNHSPGEIALLVAHIHKQQFSLEQEADEKATMYFRARSWTYNQKI